MKKLSIILIILPVIAAHIIAEEFIAPKQKRSSKVKELQKQEREKAIEILQNTPNVLYTTAAAQELLQDDILRQVEGEKPSKDADYLLKKNAAQKRFKDAQDALVIAGNELVKCNE